MKKICCLLSIIMAALIIAGCGGGKKKEGVQIVTSFFPMYVATINVTDGIDGVIQ